MQYFTKVTTATKDNQIFGEWTQFLFCIFFCQPYSSFAYYLMFTIIIYEMLFSIQKYNLYMYISVHTIDHIAGIKI